MEMTIEIPSNIESLLAEEARRRGVDPAKFVRDLLTTRLQTATPAPTVSEREAELFRAINIGFPMEKIDRQSELLEKRSKKSISDEEQTELLNSIKELERLNVERIQALSDLAKLRGVTLDEIMVELGISPPDVL